jgi:hypothetical protein
MGWKREGPTWLCVRQVGLPHFCSMTQCAKKLWQNEPANNVSAAAIEGVNSKL